MLASSSYDEHIKMYENDRNDEWSVSPMYYTCVTTCTNQVLIGASLSEPHASWSRMYESTKLLNVQ